MSTVGRMVADGLRDVPDFPQSGIVFKDISPLLADELTFKAVVEEFAGFTEGGADVDLVAGVEARGFIFAAAVAATINRGFVAVRKAGKLPPPTIRRSYELEYGTAEIEVPTGILQGKRVYLIDDVLATGGTLRAAADLLNEAGATVVGIGVVLELGFLDGRKRLDGVAPLQALLTA